MAAQETLLDLYVEHSIDEIEDGVGTLILNAFNVQHRDELLAISGYEEAFRVVSEAARQIADLVDKHPEPDDQVRSAVRLLRQMIDGSQPEETVSLFRNLIEGRLYQRRWSAPQRALYDAKVPVLEWRDFFISYTNRDAVGTNDRHRTLIRTTLGRVPAGDNKKNYVAAVISRHLRRNQNLQGFFDDRDLKVGEDIAEKVTEFCHAAFALVQIVEPLTFEVEPPRNWCFYEYSSFSSSGALAKLLGNRDRHFFIVLGNDVDDVLPARLPGHYGEWSQRMKRVKGISMSAAERNETVRSRMKEVALKILAVRTEIIDAWLSN